MELAVCPGTGMGGNCNRVFVGTVGSRWRFCCRAGFKKGNQLAHTIDSGDIIGSDRAYIRCECGFGRSGRASARPLSCWAETTARICCSFYGCIHMDDCQIILGGLTDKDQAQFSMISRNFSSSGGRKPVLRASSIATSGSIPLLMR